MYFLYDYLDLKKKKKTFFNIKLMLNVTKKKLINFIV
jgi:hypothetical protein